MGPCQRSPAESNTRVVGMDLSLAAIDQIADELNRREIPFSLIVSAKSAERSHLEEPECQLHSSLAEPVQQATHYLLGALSVFATMAEELEEQDGDAEAFKGWQGPGETLLNDVLRTAGEWEKMIPERRGQMFVGLAGGINDLHTLGYFGTKSASLRLTWSPSPANTQSVPGFTSKA